MPASYWSKSPASPRISTAEVCVFRFSLELPGHLLTRMFKDLPPDEQARADRLKSELARLRWIAARAWMREILGACLGQDPAGLRFKTNAYGKPSLVDDGDLSFNASHSGSVGLLAVTRGKAVGIDVERIQADLDWEAIARRYFAPGEAQVLFSLPPEQRTGAFYACWTRKEAYIKARGMGLSLPLDSFEVALAPGDPPRLVHPDAPWSLYAIDVGDGYASALAVEGSAEQINTWDWVA